METCPAASAPRSPTASGTWPPKGMPASEALAASAS